MGALGYKRKDNSTESKSINNNAEIKNNFGKEKKEKEIHQKKNKGASLL